MLKFSLPYVGFVDGPNNSIQNLSFDARKIYMPIDELVILHRTCLGDTINNIADYSVVIELLFDSIGFGICRLGVRLDSQLLVLQLGNIYFVTSPLILRMFLRIHLLEREFDYTEYQHITRHLNTLKSSLANHVIDRHLHNL